MVYMCRWPNGDLSFVSAPNKEQAVILLDETGNADLAKITGVPAFMVDFSLNDEGEFELSRFGERTMEAIWKAYPVLDRAQMEAEELDEGEAHTGREMIRAAVEKERTRLRGKKKRKPAATKIARALQNQADAAAAVADRIVNDVAEKILDELPPGGRKQ